MHPGMNRARTSLTAATAGAVWLLATPSAATSQLEFTSSTGPALGNVADGASGAGTTTFTVTSAGVVSQSGGGDVRVTTGTAINNLLFTCTNVAACNSYVIKIVATGSPAGRIGPVTTFTVAAGSPAPKSLTSITGSGTSTLTFTLSIAQNTSGQVHIGMHVPIPDSSSAATTGAATSSFSITSGTSGFTSGTGSATATVSRAISLAKATDLVFGMIVKPAASAGNGAVSVNAATGARTLTGTLQAGPIPAPTRASYTVTGEGGQTFSLAAPASLNMTSGANTLLVTLTNTASGTQTLSNAAGSAGTFAFGVGGSFPVLNTTPSGVYSGTFTVTVTYN